MGNALDQQIAQSLRKVFGTQAIFGRASSAEFVVFHKDLSKDTAVKAFANQIIFELKACLEKDGVPKLMEIYVGSALFPENGPTYELVTNAFLAMKLAKEESCSSYQAYVPEIRQRIDEEKRLYHDLRLALQRGSLELYYQPKYSCKSKSFHSAEALLRWIHPSKGVILPGAFISVAEKFDLIISLGNWVVDSVCHQIRKWLNEGLEMVVSVNVSPKHFTHSSFMPKIRTAMTRYSVPPPLLVVEVTESESMMGNEQCIKAMSDLAKMGVLLSMDDFGTGYSSFTYLRNLPFNQIKIDKCFIENIEVDSESREIAKTIVGLGKALGMKVVAEGVENLAQFEILTMLQCDELQGFFFEKPMPSNDFRIWLSKHRDILRE